MRDDRVPMYQQEGWAKKSSEPAIVPPIGCVEFDNHPEPLSDFRDLPDVAHCARKPILVGGAAAAERVVQRVRTGGGE